ncbi:MAG: hypothetical protein ABI823_04815 [Bryobacteraceae bacterium]
MISLRVRRMLGTLLLLGVPGGNPAIAWAAETATEIETASLRRAAAQSLAWVSNLTPSDKPVSDAPARVVPRVPRPDSAPAILQLRVMEGEGVVYGLGSRATEGFMVQVTDETGRPVEGAAVSFLLPDSGPTGTFQNGSKTEVAVTKADGRASVWGMQWNRTPGPVAVRITAVKESARAGVLSQVYISEKVEARTDAHGGPSVKSGKRWTTILIIVAGVAGGGFAAGALSGKGGAASPTAASNAPRIGSPTVILGKP